MKLKKLLKILPDDQDVVILGDLNVWPSVVRKDEVLYSGCVKYIPMFGVVSEILKDKVVEVSVSGGVLIIKV